MPNEPTLSRRLAAVAAFVRPGARLADIGTDHAYLPVYLIRHNRISAAYASDIAAGPAARAEETARRFGVREKITVRQAPGLSGADAFAPTDIVIAGMGGELIAAILEDAPFVRDPSIRLILQPMTKQDVLRGYLCASGFAILDERAVKEERKIYQVIVCAYNGTAYSLTPAEKLIGPVNLKRRDDAANELIGKKLAELQKSARGKKAGGVFTKEDEELISALSELTGRSGAN